MAQQALNGRFIGREQHLARLHDHLQKAVQGTGQVCFITGEPGAGKTALVSEFTRTAQTHNDRVIVTFGDCNALSAEGDPYLPFREIMALLLGDVEGGIAEGNITPENAGRLRKFFSITRDALIESGPDIVGIFVPGGSLLARMGTKLIQGNPSATGSRSGVDQSQILHQFTSVLCRLAKQDPIIVVIDDLHWADTASINMLFHLARRIEGSPILIVGTFRPHEMEAGRGEARHPLSPVINELKRYYGDITIDLDADDDTERRTFVDELLNSDHNGFPPSFSEQLFLRTDGHPLFTVELINALKERGVIRREGAGWSLSGEVDWSGLPSRVEGIIDERVRRIAPALLELLTFASMEGEQFSVEVLARVSGISPLDTARQLGEAEQKHRLLRAYGMRREGSVRLSQYRFAHNLFQRYLYDRISVSERTYRHEAVAAAIEDVFAGDTAHVAVQLGHHYAMARNCEKAAHFLRQAGDAAKRKYAHTEALDLYRRALEFADQLGEDAELMRAELNETIGDVCLAIGRSAHGQVYLESALSICTSAIDRARIQGKIAKGYADRYVPLESRAMYDSADATLASDDARGTLWWQTWTTLRLNRAWLYYFHDPTRLHALIEETAPHMEFAGTHVDRANFFQLHVLANLRDEQYRLTKRTTDVAELFLAAARDAGDAYRVALAVFQAGFCALWAGSNDTARAHLEDSLRMAERMGAAFPGVPAATYLAVEARMRGDMDRNAQFSRIAEAWLSEATNPAYRANAIANTGWLMYRNGAYSEAAPVLENALRMWQEMSQKAPFFWLASMPLAAMRARAGDVQGAAEMLAVSFGPEQQALDPALMRAIEEAVASRDPADIGVAIDLAAHHGLH